MLNLINMNKHLFRLLNLRCLFILEFVQNCKLAGWVSFHYPPSFSSIILATWCAHLFCSKQTHKGEKGKNKRVKLKVCVLPLTGDVPFVNNATRCTVALSGRHGAPACRGDSHPRNLIIAMSTCTQKNNSVEQTALQCEFVHNPLLSERKVTVCIRNIFTLFRIIAVLYTYAWRTPCREHGGAICLLLFVYPSLGLPGMSDFSFVLCKIYIKNYSPLLAVPDLPGGLYGTQRCCCTF
jgi:hypothetical protein